MTSTEEGGTGIVLRFEATDCGRLAVLSDDGVPVACELRDGHSGPHRTFDGRTWEDRDELGEDDEIEVTWEDAAAKTCRRSYASIRGDRAIWFQWDGIGWSLTIDRTEAGNVVSSSTIYIGDLDNLGTISSIVEEIRTDGRNRYDEPLTSGGSDHD